MRNTIVRTFNTVHAKCLIYIDGALSDAIILVPSETATTASAEKYIRKTNSCTGKLVSVESLEKSSDIYGMDESDFLRLATRITERGKATRNCVTKLVNYYVADYVYMDIATRQVKSRSITFPIIYKGKFDKYAKAIEQPGEKAICIENEHELTALYAMSETDFKRNAKRMKDYQHYCE